MDTKARINEIISREQYKLTQAEKNKILFPILIEKIKRNMSFSSELNKFYNSFKMNPEKLKKIADIPPIPVSMFKEFDLKTCPDEKIKQILKSSGTTNQKRSKIFIDKETAFRQSKALISILKNFLGKNRRPILVIDTENVVKKGDTLTARGAAIRGVSQFGRKIVYVMDEKDGDLFLNKEKLIQFSEEFSGKEILVSGFTYIIWSKFVSQLKSSGLTVNFPEMKLVHSGGWKKLKNQAV
ncbi:MAG: acyl-protein synthetase, partial [archaeon]|nr:acyl-protein synthetase [archaeon]